MWNLKPLRGGGKKGLAVCPVCTGKGCVKDRKTGLVRACVACKSGWVNVEPKTK